MKYIFTIATNIYTEYFENFKNSINNFYQGEDKTLIVFSNKLKEYNNVQIDNTIIKIVDIPNLVYTSIFYNKFNFIIWYCENNNISEDELIYFFDIDSYFYNNPAGCKHLDEEIKNNISSVIFSLHPFYIAGTDPQCWVKNVHGYIEDDDGLDKNRKWNNYYSKLYNDDYSFTKYGLFGQDCIVSFFAGTFKSINDLNEIYIKYYKKMLENRILPPINDEDIFNYILLKQLRGEINEQYIYAKHYYINININTLNDYKVFHILRDHVTKIPENIIEYLICNQKYDVNKKLIVKENYDS